MPSCPGHDILEHFAAGTASRCECRELVRHLLARCDICAARLRSAILEEAPMDTKKQGVMFSEMGQALRALRESAGLSQAELARKAGMGKSQVSKYERGKELPKLESLAKLLQVFDAEPLTLFYTAHLLKHRAEISPSVALLATPTPLLQDPALESFRRLFAHFLESFEILVATRPRPQTPGEIHDR